MITNPHMLPKIRSDDLRQSCGGMPCTLRIASFAGLPCAHQNTVVGCHLPVFGKGKSTKVSDIYLVAACRQCHDLLDFERNPIGFEIAEKYPRAFWTQVFKAFCETQARWVEKGMLIVPGSRII